MKIGEISERHIAVLKLRRSGMTFREIGAEFSISGTYAQKLAAEAMRYENRKPQWYDGLSIRAANVLIYGGIGSKEQAMTAFISKKIDPDRSLPRNYGWKIHLEVARWLGLSRPIKRKPLKN